MSGGPHHAHSGQRRSPSKIFARDASGAIERDTQGRVVGGIELAQFTAPTAEIAPNGKAVFCILGGHHRDFTAAELKARYETHDAYVAKVSQAMTAAAKEGYILPFDRDEAIRVAEASDIAR